jgi:hypothetical protein
MSQIRAPTRHAGGSAPYGWTGGTQLACYWLMRRVTSFSVVGFWQAWAALFWAVLNVPQLQASMAYFRRYVVARTQALVTTSLDAREARYFLRRYPHARRIDVGLDGQPYYVLLAPSTGTRPESH